LGAEADRQLSGRYGGVGSSCERRGGGDTKKGERLGLKKKRRRRSEKSRITGKNLTVQRRGRSGTGRRYVNKTMGPGPENLITSPEKIRKKKQTRVGGSGKGGDLKDSPKCIGLDIHL